MAIKGVDTIYHTLTGKTLAAHDYQFACRYYAGHTSRIGKEIIASEVVEKSKAGVRIVSNWETDGKPADTIAAGEAHARAFLRQHAEIGGPTWAPCYFSIDHTVAAGACDLYFEGVRNVLGVKRAGCYGGGALIRHLKTKGLISLGWLAMATAWPGSKDHTGCDIIQEERGAVAGHDVDFDTALSSYYGGWLLGETQPTPEDDMDQTTFSALLAGALRDDNVQEKLGIAVWHHGDIHIGGVTVTAATALAAARAVDSSAIVAGIVAALGTTAGDLTAQQIEDAAAAGTQRGIADALRQLADASADDTSADASAAG